MALLKKLAGETAIYGISNVVSRMVNFLLVPLYTRILKGTDEYSVVIEMYAYVGLIMVLATYRMETGFFRFGSDAGQKEKTFTTSMMSLLATTPVLVLLGIVFSQGIADAIKLPDKPHYVVWFAIILGLDTLTRVPLAKLRLDGRPMMFVFVQMTNIAVNVGLNLFFLIVCPWLIQRGFTGLEAIYHPDRLVDYIFISNMAASGVMLLLLLPTFLGGGWQSLKLPFGILDKGQRSTPKLRWQFDPVLFRKMMWYVGPLIFVGVASVINEVIDKVLLVHLLPGTTGENRAMAGIYAANYKLATLMTIITQGFNYAAEPFFFNNKGRKDTAQLYGKVGQSFAIIGSVAFLGIMLFLPVVQKILGERFIEPEGTAIIPIILLANLFLGLYYNFAIWYKLADKTQMGLYIAGAGVVVTLSMNIGLIPVWGIMASAWATLCCYAVMAVLAYALGQRHYPIHYPIPRMLGYVLAAVFSYLLVDWILGIYGTGIPGWAEYLGKALVFTAYMAYIYWMEKKHLLREVFGAADEKTRKT